MIFCGSKKDTETLAGVVAQSKDYSRGVGSQVCAKDIPRLFDNGSTDSNGYGKIQGVRIGSMCGEYSRRVLSRFIMDSQLL